MRIFAIAVTTLVLLAGAGLTDRSFAQTPEPPVAQLDDVVVLARRSGAPMWTVTRGDSTLILVGAITGIPRDLSWRPDDLEAAAARSDQILSRKWGGPRSRTCFASSGASAPLRACRTVRPAPTI